MFVCCQCCLVVWLAVEGRVLLVVSDGVTVHSLCVPLGVCVAILKASKHCLLTFAARLLALSGFALEDRRRKIFQIDAR